VGRKPLNSAAKKQAKDEVDDIINSIKIGYGSRVHVHSVCCCLSKSFKLLKIQTFLALGM